MHALISTLRDEHRSITAVLLGMRELVRERRQYGATIDPRVFRAMLYYLDVFPEREHHRKEEDYLFAAMRRHGAAAGALDELAEEHAVGEQAMRDLEQAFVRYEEGGGKELGAFENAVERFIAGYLEHMRKEEATIFPLALATLTAEEWAEIESAWAAHRDPLAGAAANEEYKQLFNRIVLLAPAPVGVGPVFRKQQGT